MNRWQWIKQSISQRAELCRLRWSGCSIFSMPYAYRYANTVDERGIFGGLKDTTVSDSIAGDIVGMLTKGGSVLFEKDLIKVIFDRYCGENFFSVSM